MIVGVKIWLEYTSTKNILEEKSKQKTQIKTQKVYISGIKGTVSLKHRLHEIIYEADTTAGKLFDLVLLVLILASVILVMLESVTVINEDYHSQLDIAEWVITILFSMEYVLRIVIVNRPWKYVVSFYGIIDLLSILPKYISLLVGGAQGLAVLRAIRLLRVFRVLKLTRYIGESNHLMIAMRRSRPKVLVFLFVVFVLCIVLGSIMYLVEGDEGGFTSIPKSVYWCIVTLTTVGYGDIAPITPLGQFLASVIMIIGYGIIAVPTGIIGVEIAQAKKIPTNTQSCPNCLEDKHLDKAIYCHECGGVLNEES